MRQSDRGCEIGPDAFLEHRPDQYAQACKSDQQGKDEKG